VEGLSVDLAVRMDLDRRRNQEKRRKGDGEMKRAVVPARSAILQRSKRQVLEKKTSD
jgi:hypothetical protein